MIKKLLLFTCLLASYQCCAMEKEEKPQEEQQRQDRKEREFEERCRLMRQEQERRKEQAAREEITIKTEFVKGEGFECRSLDIEGMPFDDFVEILKEIKEEKKEQGEKNRWKHTACVFSHSSKAFAQTMENEHGLEKIDGQDNAFCTPGNQELGRKLLAIAKKVMEEEEEEK